MVKKKWKQYFAFFVFYVQTLDELLLMLKIDMCFAHHSTFYT